MNRADTPPGTMPPEVRAERVLARARSLEGGSRPPWPEVARIIDEVEASGAWRQDGAKSFTAWVVSAARRWRTSQVLLWRYRGAARLLGDYLAAMREAGVTPAADHADAPDPEVVTLLVAIRRHVDPERFASLAQRAFASQSARNELRRIWSSIRNAGEAAANDIDRNFASRVLAALQDPEPAWLGPGTRLVELLRGEELGRWIGAGVGSEVTAVTTDALAPDARLHYLHYGSKPNAANSRKLAALLPLYDTCWQIVRHDDLAGGLRPRGFGLLRLMPNGALESMQTPEARGAGARAGNTARRILAYRAWTEI